MTWNLSIFWVMGTTSMVIPLHSELLRTYIYQYYYSYQQYNYDQHHTCDYYYYYNLWPWRSTIGLQRFLFLQVGFFFFLFLSFFSFPFFLSFFLIRSVAYLFSSVPGCCFCFFNELWIYFRKSFVSIYLLSFFFSFFLFSFFLSLNSPLILIFL